MSRLLALMIICAVALAAPALGYGDETEKKAKAPQRERAYTSLKSWVMVDAFTVSIIQDGRVRGRFTVSFGMDVPDATLRAKAQALMPRLRDAWLSELNLHAATALRPKREADVAAVSELLQRTADGVLGARGTKVLMAQATVAMTD